MILSFIFQPCSKAIAKTLSLGLCFILFSERVEAQSSSELDQYLQQSTVKTYDCPENDEIQSIERYLQSENLSQIQQLQLTAKKTHWQICNGNYEEARQTLESMLAQHTDFAEHEFFAAATYQLAFVYDMQANPKLCELYQRAKDLSEDRYTDINLSARLGLITMCNQQNDDGVKLAKMYALVEQYSDRNEPAALAHIHNNIGLLYGALGQHMLAAEQYQKAYELGLNEYTSSNQLATLISVISSLMASGNFEQAQLSIDEFRRVNQSVNTPLSNVWLHFAEAGYYYRTNDMDKLKQSLFVWQLYLEEVNSTMYDGLFRWYSAVVCLAQQDEACLRDFLLQEEQASEGYKAFITRNKDYLKFMVDIHLYFEDLQQINYWFDKFSKVMMTNFMQQQASGKVLGVANLHSQVINLENSLQQTKDERFRTIAIITAVIFVLGVILALWLRQKYLNSLAYDSTTGLYHSRAALTRIRRVTVPSKGRANALALFDLGNFRDVNRQLGATNSEQALKQIAQTLSQVTRERDILGRFAPEQFIVCLTDIEEDSAKSFFERMRFALENTILGSQQGQSVSVRSSMSIYISNDAFDDLDEVLDDMQLSLSIRNES